LADVVINSARVEDSIETADVELTPTADYLTWTKAVRNNVKVRA
jgi:hypothetical protein